MPPFHFDPPSFIVPQHAAQALGSSGAAVCFAGSRHGTVKQTVSNVLVSSFARLGSRFLVGCAPGVGRCFRMALAASPAPIISTVRCAFPSRLRSVEQEGLHGVCLVASAPSTAAALHRRTVAMVSRCSLLVLFPDNPITACWGRGSRLAFNTAVQRHIPVFVATAIPPLGSRNYTVEKGSLFGIVSGYRVVAKEAVHVR